MAVERLLLETGDLLLLETGDALLLESSSGGSAYTLACDAGSFTISGQDATLVYAPGTRAYTLACDAGSFVISGQAANLVWSGAQVTERRHAGGYKLRKGYLIKGRRYFLSDDELAVHIAHMLQEVSRGDVKEITAGKPKVINRRTWDAIKPLERLSALSDMLATELIAEDDDEETLLMLM